MTVAKAVNTPDAANNIHSVNSRVSFKLYISTSKFCFGRSYVFIMSYVCVELLLHHNNTYRMKCQIYIIHIIQVAKAEKITRMILRLNPKESQTMFRVGVKTTHFFLKNSVSLFRA